MAERRRASPARAVAIVLALVGGTIAPSPARAHLGHVILNAERYLKLDATSDDTRLVVSLMLGEDEGLRVLAAADADGDYEVSRAEADAYLAEWAAGLREEIPVELDGEPLELEWTDGWLDPIGRVRRVPLTVEMVAHLPTEGREHAIVFQDRMVRRETFDRTDVAFRGHEGAVLVACGPEREPNRCDAPELAIVRGGPQPTVFGARIQYPEHDDPRSPIVLAIAGTGALLGAAAAAALGRRRARRRDDAAPS